MKIADYRIVAASQSAELSTKVAALIAEGWQPWWGPFEKGGLIQQAMVRYVGPA